MASSAKSFDCLQGATPVLFYRGGKPQPRYSRHTLVKPLLLDVEAHAAPGRQVTDIGCDFKQLLDADLKKFWFPAFCSISF
jgi:hypothetical protein